MYVSVLHTKTNRNGRIVHVPRKLVLELVPVLVNDDLDGDEDLGKLVARGCEALWITMCMCVCVCERVRGTMEQQPLNSRHT